MMRLGSAWLAALLLAGCVSAPPPADGTAHRFMVAAAHPLATDAGHQMLKAGGSAIDAGIAVQLVLTLVEPQSSGIGGGVFIVHHDGKQVQTIDGRETAPAAATPDLFMKDGRPMGFMEGVVGGRSVGVPGTLRALELAHRAHGKLPWKALFQPAIRLAEEGFAISPRLAYFLRDPVTAESLKRDADARAYFYET
ncbi:MAG: gamma-glutamyltransferase, partial [Cytophagales bacterium]|nr:gamma-glutamyltransferase [Rhizobacter sp.]